MGSRRPMPLEYKTDMEETARRWEAYYAGEIIDRPVVCVTAPKRPGHQTWYESSYWDAVHGDMDEMIDRAIEAAEGTYYGGEAVPRFRVSFGPDEIAAFCGGELVWSEGSEETNWSKPFVDDWEAALPLGLQDGNPLWQRMLTFLGRAGERLYGKTTMAPLDLHSNMDILAAVRGPERLCMDLLDRPEVIDRAMASARAIFPKLWEAITKAGRMDEMGYCDGLYSPDGAAILQCDFAIMIRPEMFERWVMPALEEEAEIVKHVYYHMDGPEARVHLGSLCRSKGLHTIQYQPGAAGGDLVENLDTLKRIQEGGKACPFWGSAEECKRAHKELKPEKVYYSTWAASPEEAEALLEWFVKNT